MSIFMSPDSFNARLATVIENEDGGEEFEDEEELEESLEAFVSTAAMMVLLEEDQKDELIDSGEIEEMEEDGQVLESTMVRLDRDARKKQLTRVISYRIAREKNDPDFKKLTRIWRIERNLEEKINRKYASQARRMAEKELRDNYKQVGRKFKKVRGKGVRGKARKGRKK